MSEETSGRSQIRTLLRFGMRKLRQDGFVSFVKSAVEHVRRLSIPKQAQSAFDRRYGTDTTGTIPLWKLQIRSPHHAEGVRYQASDPDFVRKAIEILQIPLERFVYIDVGSGKGLTLLVASEYPFRRVLGIEFAAELNAIAAENISRLRAPRCRDISSVLADAASYRFPTEDTVLFLYNPFGQDVLKHMLNNLRSALEQNDHELYIVYSNPIFSQILDQSGFLDRLDLPIGAAIYRHLPTHGVLQHDTRAHIHVVGED
jgi:predicted RNA methylase